MSTVFDKPSLWPRVRPVFLGFDGPLSAGDRCCSPRAGC